MGTRRQTLSVVSAAAHCSISIRGCISCGSAAAQIDLATSSLLLHHWRDRRSAGCEVSGLRSGVAPPPPVRLPRSLAGIPDGAWFAVHNGFELDHERLLGRRRPRWLRQRQACGVSAISGCSEIDRHSSRVGAFARRRHGGARGSRAARLARPGGTEIAATPHDYQRYIQRSAGEFSCAKPSCIRMQNAWISDRTVCYLASGKPAVVQHTGVSRYLPDSAGLFRFSNPVEAVQH